VEGISAPDRVRAVRCDLISDPPRSVGGDVGDGGATGFAQRGEERSEGLAVPSRRGPHQPAGVMVDDDRDVPVALLVADLTDPDPGQTGQRVPGCHALVDHPGHDRPDRAPGDPQ